MERYDARKLFYHVRHAKDQTISLQDALNEIDGSIGSVNLTEVSGKSDGQTVPRIVERREKIRDQLRYEQRLYAELTDMACRVLTEMETHTGYDTYAMVLRDRFIANMSYSEIAEKRNYAESYIPVKVMRALDIAQDFMPIDIGEYEFLAK